jgi:hypothetical protein
MVSAKDALQAVQAAHLQGNAQCVIAVLKCIKTLHTKSVNAQWVNMEHQIFSQTSLCVKIAIQTNATHARIRLIFVLLVSQVLLYTFMITSVLAIVRHKLFLVTQIWLNKNVIHAVITVQIV